MKRIVFCIACVFGLLTQVTGQLPPSLNSKNRGLRTLQEAIADPFNEDKLQALKMNLPRDHDLFVVEGDLLLTDQELFAYIVSKSQSEKRVDTSAELIVNVHNGRRDYYADPDKRALSYAVDRQSFPDEEMYKVTVENMQIATRDWQDACPECKIQFDYNPKFDLLPSTESVNFVVRYRDVKGNYIAAAFFPHDGPVRRYLNIDPSYFKSSFDKAGVLRHELGHVLGYRHEQTRGVVGCYYEDNKWQPLTEYDAKSVMHYFCGGGGSFSLNLSDTDKAGHRKLYTQTNASIGTDLKRHVRVRFEGVEVAETLPQVLKHLTSLSLINTKPYTVTELGESLKSVYRKNLFISQISTDMLRYAIELNKDKRMASQQTLKIGEEVLYPDIEVKPRPKLVVINETSKEDLATYKEIKSVWPAGLVTEVRKSENTIALFLQSYELNLEFTSEKDEEKARAELLRLKNDLKAKYLVLGGSTISPQKPPSFSTGLSIYAHSPVRFSNSTPTSFAAKQTPQQFIDAVTNNGGRIDLGIEGDLSLYLGEINYPPPPSPCERHEPKDCPEIFLVDKAVAKHPDIPESIKQSTGISTTPPIDSSNKQLIRIPNKEGFDELYHGTYMAGIIASQPNGFGLVGIYPKADIISLDWDLITTPSDTERRDEIIRDFADFIHDRSRRYYATPSSSMPIFVFATEWKFRDALEKENDRFDTEGHENPDVWRDVAATIELSRPLIIVSAGQPKTGAPQRITTISPEGPRNLGDLENVIVVTAIGDDGVVVDGRPGLWPNANFIDANDPQKLVHVAAPGLRILSTIPSTGSDQAAFYAVASGTSQATAFVAGVVSSMVAAYPGKYRDPHEVKTRLQVTSNPFLRRVDAGKLAAGMIDFNLAMHDPTKDWFKKKGEPNYVAASNLKWLREKLELIDPSGNPIAPISTKKIYRIVVRDDVWYVYTAERTKQGQIKKHGPGRPKPGDVGLKLFELATTGASVEYALNQIEDLVLFLPYASRP